MTIDEAIEYVNERAKYHKGYYDSCPARIRYRCEDCFHKPKCNEVAEIYEQVAEWLEELKCYRNDNGFSEYADKLYKTAYNKAIEDFAEKLMEEQIFGCMLPDGFRTDIVTSHTIDTISKKLKKEV